MYVVCMYVWLAVIIVTEAERSLAGNRVEDTLCLCASGKHVRR